MWLARHPCGVVYPTLAWCRVAVAQRKSRRSLEFSIASAKEKAKAKYVSEKKTSLVLPALRRNSISEDGNFIFQSFELVHLWRSRNPHIIPSRSDTTILHFASCSPPADLLFDFPFVPLCLCSYEPFFRTLNFGDSYLSLDFALDGELVEPFRI